MKTIEIVELSAEVERLEKQLADAKTKLIAAWKEAAKVEVGDIVLDGCGERRQVSRVEATVSGSIYLHGYKLNSRGEFGKRESYIGLLGYGCQKVTDVR